MAFLVVMRCMIFCSLLTLVKSAPLPEPREVFVPPILSPTNGTVWKIGTNHTVIWDVSNAPKHITNRVGMIVLAKGGTLLLDDPLAKDFDIMQGKETVQIPKKTVPDNDYQIILFGDSGNGNAGFISLNE